MSDLEISGVTHSGKAAENNEVFPSKQSAGWLENTSRKLVLGTFQSLKHGSLTVVEGKSTYHFGEAHNKTGLQAHIRVHNPGVYRELLFGGSIGAGESYMMAEWSTPCLVSVVRVLCANMEVLNQMDGRWSS